MGSAWSSPRFWLLLALTGVGAGIGAGVLMAILHAVQHLAYGYRSGPFQAAVERDSGLRRLAVMAGAGLLMGSAWMLLRRWSGPGRGLTEAVWEHDGRLPFLRTMLNGVLQIVAVALGATLGREGAPKETGAGIASQLSEMAGLSRDQRRLLVACGAGAGMAAVYNVPLGGALFAVEILLGTVSLPLVVPALATAGIATAVSWLLLPDRATYLVPPVSAPATVVVWAILLGPIAGLLGAGYIVLVGKAKAAKPKRWHVVVTILMAFTVVGSVSIVYPQVLGNGKDLTQLLLLARVGLPVVAAVLVIRPLAMALCLRSGAEGGLFTPTLAFGALAGSLLGHGWSEVWPGGHAAAFTMIGATAVLAGTMQSPLAAIALVVELTHSGIDLIVPMALAVTGAMVVCRLLEPWSIYTVGGHVHRPHWARVQRPGALRRTSAAPVAARGSDAVSEDSGSREDRGSWHDVGREVGVGPEEPTSPLPPGTDLARPEPHEPPSPPQDPP